MSGDKARVNIEEPRYDQNTYIGRVKHFLITTNPLNVLATNTQLDKAKSIVEKYRKGDDIPGLSEDELWRSKQLYDSAFHPDTKEKMMLIGRMSAQVPMNMCITGSMMTFYRTAPAVIFWQWFNQTFNAVVNYTNRSGNDPVPVSQLGLSYVLASGGAVGTAMGIKSLVKTFPPVVARLVPFTAVASANCINIPFMRSRELMEGITVMDEEGNKLGESKLAAKSAIGQVLLSRIMMALPGMTIPPFIMNHLEKKSFMKKMPWLNAPIQVSLVGLFLIFATPLCCAMFPQKSSMSVQHLEKDLQDKIKALPNPPQRVYFNKGL
ncbi:sideroflexin-1-like [Mizuhopecten yessoensis]|uniref:Sidoreflexin n=1 Tax=Mizuhopecten yessoensis TaxID=6573 RepID=A0A210R2B0_MIZYE|nr:sideroflexin-1-like [Mizuhopecten yessoensis]OWF55046.1 Sideroflexin-1 [Mizuhopecten yessoensis]